MGTVAECDSSPFLSLGLSAPQQIPPLRREVWPEPLPWGPFISSKVRPHRPAGGLVGRGEPGLGKHEDFPDLLDCVCRTRIRKVRHLTSTPSDRCGRSEVTWGEGVTSAISVNQSRAQTVAACGSRATLHFHPQPAPSKDQAAKSELSWAESTSLQRSMTG